MVVFERGNQDISMKMSPTTCYEYLLRVNSPRYMPAIYHIITIYIEKWVYIPFQQLKEIKKTKNSNLFIVFLNAVSSACLPRGYSLFNDGKG
jgi:hypothetical protein